MAQGVENEAQRDLLTAAPIHDQSARFLLQRTGTGERRHATLAAKLIEPRLSQVFRSDCGEVADESFTGADTRGAFTLYLSKR